MIVEDDAITNLDLKSFFQSQGFNVTSADRYETAINTAIVTLPDIIIMDIILKGDKTGFDVANEVKKHCNPKIIFCTALTDKNTIQQINDLNYFYFNKPVNNVELLKLIKKL